MFTYIRTDFDAPVHELIARSRKTATSLMTTTSRRLVRRARQHGVQMVIPAIFSGDHVLLRHGSRILRIDMDGAIIPAGSLNDPGWRSNAVRLHALNLRMAARFRRHRNIQAARDSLALCRLDHSEWPKLPG